MARFTIKRQEQIFTDMLARMVARTELSDVSDTSAWKHLLAAAARQDDEIYYQVALLLALFSIDKARGDDLDERAKDVQPDTLERIQGTYAGGVLVFSRNSSSGTSAIRIGQRVKTPDGQTFETTEAALITPTSVERISGHGVGRDSNPVAAIAIEEGSAGNAAAGTITIFTSRPSGVDAVTNLAKFTGGEDEETDPAFRKRIKDYIRSLARCPVSSLEGALVGQTDPETGGVIRYAKVVEDLITVGAASYYRVTMYIDDGTGTAEAIAEVIEPIVETYTWNGTTTVTAAVTTEVVAGDWVRLDSDGQLFQIDSVLASTSFDIFNPGGDTIPTGATPSSKAVDILTEGFSVGDVAVGGETRLKLNHSPIRSDLPIVIATSVQGNMVAGTDYTVDPTTGDVVLTTPLVAGESVAAAYTRYTGLVEFAQKIVNGDPNDRTTYPGYRAAGVQVTVKAPQVLLQDIVGVVAIQEGYNRTDVLAAVTQAIRDYVNSLTIGANLIRAKLIEAIASVDGVYDVQLVTPADNVVALDDQLIRTAEANLDLV